MKYVNAADVLPKELFMEVAKYAGGKLLYVPIISKRCAWGEKNGSKQYFRERNQKIKEAFRQGKTLDELSIEFSLSRESIRRIVKE